MGMYNFTINSDNGIVSKKITEMNIHDFNGASKFIAELSYKRNLDKSNILCVFEDKGGTCSTKHAVLKKLALENQQDGVKLILGIFKMDSKYAPSIKKTLNEHGLIYIPEAHNYLKIENQYFDFTRPGSDYNEFKDNILFETEIRHDQIISEKISIHRKFLQEWIINEKINYSLEEIWRIREKCIEDLQNQNNEYVHSNSSPVCFQNSPEIRDEYKQ